MWPEIFEFVRTMIAVVLCSAAVKLVDDYLDKDLDFRAGRRNIADAMGNGTMVYAMLFLVIAAGMNTAVSMPLFLASYIVGMFNDLKSRFPSRLNGLQETFLVMLLGVLFFGFASMLFALLFVLGIQLLDDCLDLRSDVLTGQRNFAHRFGVTECVISGIMAILLAGWLNEQIFWPVFFGTAFFYVSLIKYQGARI